MTHSLVVVGLNHRTAPVELRERLSVPPDALETAAVDVAKLPHVREAMVVATCNRVEVYACGDEVAACARSIREYFSARASGSVVDESLYEHHGAAAVRHVFRVAASLDSMVVGEPQILGQVKEAFNAAQGAGTLGPDLRRALVRAFAAAKRVRTETQIGAGTVSVASVAVDLAAQIFGELKGRRVLLVGAGKMALGATRALVARGATLSIANRNYEKAQQLAREHGGDPHPLESLELLLPHVDVVLCSTGAPRYVVSREMVKHAMKTRRGRSLFLIDIAVPRNIDPRTNDVENVYLFDVDDLEREVVRAIETRGGSITAAEVIVEDEIRAYDRERRTGAVAPTIAALREHFRQVARLELEKSLGARLKHLDDKDRASLEALLDATVNKLLHAPTMALRNSAQETDQEALATIVNALFRLEGAATDGDAKSDPRGGDATSGGADDALVPVRKVATAAR